MLLLTFFLLLVTWEGFANCCQRLKICNPCNRWAPRVSGILWRQTSTVLFPSSIVVQEIWFSLKAKSLENRSCHFAEIIVVKETLTNYLFRTLHPASYCACCGFPWKGKCLVLQCWAGWAQAGQGPAPLLKAPARDARQAALAAQPPVFWQGAILPDSSGAEFGGPGVQRHPTGGEERTLGKEPLVTRCLLQASIGCGRSCPLELRGCCGRDLVQGQLAVGCFWNGANRNWNFPPTLFFSCFFSLPSLKFLSWFFYMGCVWSQQWNALFCSLKFVPVFSVTSLLCLWERNQTL